MTVAELEAFTRQIAASQSEQSFSLTHAWNTIGDMRDELDRAAASIAAIANAIRQLEAQIQLQVIDETIAGG